MFNVFIFFVKNPGIRKDEDANKEYKFFFERICIEEFKENDSKYVRDKSLENYYFAVIQNDLFNEKNMKLIGHINELCLKVREFMVKKEPDNFNPDFIIAVHPPGALITEKLIEWQVEMNRLTRDLKDFNAQIVYYSSRDKENPFLEKNKEYNYKYATLFDADKEDEVIEQEFEKFLNLLKARAEGKEAEFFDLKKKIDDLYHVFSLKALACKGIMKCIKREKYGTARNYQLQSFGNKDFIEILKDLKKDKEYIEDRINGKLNELNPEYYEGLPYYEQLNKYFKWYNEFLNILIDKKKEVEKGE